MLSDFPVFEPVVAEFLGLSCFGFRASLLPRLLLPFDIGFPFKNATGSLERLRGLFVAGFPMVTPISMPVGFKTERWMSQVHNEFRTSYQAISTHFDELAIHGNSIY